jgi:hypothetical protein
METQTPLPHSTGHQANNFIVAKLLRPANLDGLAFEVIPVQGQDNAAGHILYSNGLKAVPALPNYWNQRKYPHQRCQGVDELIAFSKY